MAGGRKVTGSAPPQVELVLARAADGAHIVHLLNHSGAQDRSFHAPLPIVDIALSVALDAAPGTTARCRVGNTTIPVTFTTGRAAFRVPRLDDFEVIVIPTA